MKRIKEIEERVNAATPEPWGINFPDYGWNTPKILNKDCGILAEFTHYHPMEKDAAFVAHARQDVPYLLETLQRAIEVIEDLSDDAGYNDNERPPSHYCPSNCPTCRIWKQAREFLKEVQDE